MVFFKNAKAIRNREQETVQGLLDFCFVFLIGAGRLLPSVADANGFPVSSFSESLGSILTDPLSNN
jgi:hypothetical protein